MYTGYRGPGKHTPDRNVHPVMRFSWQWLWRQLSCGITTKSHITDDSNLCTSKRMASQNEIIERFNIHYFRQQQYMGEYLMTSRLNSAQAINIHRRLLFWQETMRQLSTAPSRHWRGHGTRVTIESQHTGSENHRAPLWSFVMCVCKYSFTQGLC